MQLEKLPAIVLVDENTNAKVLRFLGHVDCLSQSRVDSQARCEDDLTRACGGCAWKDLRRSEPRGSKSAFNDHGRACYRLRGEAQEDMKHADQTVRAGDLDGHRHTEL